MMQRHETHRAGVVSDKMIWGLIAVGLIVVVAVTRPFGGGAGGPDHIGWSEDYQRAAEQAQTTGRPMLVYFTADWCGPCQRMKRDVFPDDQVVQTIQEGFIPVKVDLTSMNETNSPIAERFGIQSIPTMVVVNGRQQELGRVGGLMGARNLVDWLSQYAAQKPTAAARG